MSFLKKLGAVALGTASAAGWVASAAIKAGLEAAGDKLGNGSATSSSGRTYTRSDFQNSANQAKKGEGFFEQGFKAAGKLWNDED
ncbi:MAG: hypothetical protein J5654_04715 [Victivallales bacterium]|nr:hypothetical protein [Victivallales bacterium]